MADKDGATGTKLVIVESPAKAKTIGGYLGRGYVVEASIGHIRDLPRNAADVPAKYKGESWARLGVNTEHDFEPLYVVSPDRKQQVTKLKKLVQEADEIYLATDEDREGEAIAWHLVETLNPKIPVRRMVFHEITPSAIAAAVANPREINEQPRRRAGDPAHPRPALRLRGQPGAVEEGAAGAVRGPGAVRRHPDDRRARARTDGVPQRQLLGRRRHLRPGRAEAGRPADVHRDARQRRRHPARHRPRLRPGHRPRPGQRPAPGRGRRAGPGRPARRPRVRRPGRRGEAVPAPSVPAVHDLDAAAGGRPQVPLVRAAGHAHRAAAVRERLHHLYADGLDDAVRDRAHRGPVAGPRAVRRRVRAGRAAPLHAQGEERAGGARGDPAGRRQLPHAGRGRQPRRLRRVPALRADLAAHPRLADGRRGRHDRLDPAGRDVGVRRGGRVHHERPDDHLPRFPARLRRGPRRGRRRARRRGEAAAQAGPRRRPRPAQLRADRAHHVAARALHRAVARQGDGGARRRPAVDVRLDHADDPGPRLRVEEGPGARPDLDRVRGDRAARAALRPARRLRLHRVGRERPRRHRQRRALAHRVADRTSTSATRRPPPPTRSASRRRAG